MPKVSETYLSEKRNFILECTEEILQEKPLYLITVRDIIKKAGFSQGVIYRYYGNLDEIYIDFINQYVPRYPLEERIDQLIGSEKTPLTILSQCLTAMGDYIDEMWQSIVGKTFFELMVLYAYDREKRAAIFPQLKCKQSLEYAQQKIVEYTLMNIEKNIFHPQVPVQAIMTFVGCFIDGLAQSLTMNTADDRDNPPDVPEMFQLLAKTVVHFLEAQTKGDNKNVE